MIVVIEEPMEVNIFTVYSVNEVSNKVEAMFRLNATFSAVPSITFMELEGEITAEDISGTRKQIEFLPNDIANAVHRIESHLTAIEEQVEWDHMQDNVIVFDRLGGPRRYKVGVSRGDNCEWYYLSGTILDIGEEIQSETEGNPSAADISVPFDRLPEMTKMVITELLEVTV